MSSDSREVDAAAHPLRSVSIALLFVGSGCAALIYEVAWFHLLRLVIGGSWISLGILLASFMGGMCLGSLGLPLVVPARFHPLRVYAALELAIGAIGGTLPWWLPWMSTWYIAHADPSFTGISARAIVAAVAIVPVTTLMGATLPAVARWVKSTPQGLSQLGIFYGANIVGAVLGCLTAGFVLLPKTDVVYATGVAAAINGAIAVFALALAHRTPYVPPIESGATETTDRQNAPAIICAVVALSGFAALGAEVVWTRLLALLFGSTVYTFSIILAVFLAGLGIGSTVAAWWVKWTRFPARWLVVSQLAIVFFVPYANLMITHVVPFQLRPAVHETTGVYAVFAHDTRRAAAAILPAAIFWGASFPLALAAAARDQRDTGRLVGQLYAANTLGAILGSLLIVAVFVPLLGSQRTQQVLVLVSGLAAILAASAAARTPVFVGPEMRGHGSRTSLAAVDAAFSWLATMRGRATLLVLCGIAMWYVVPPRPGMLGRSLRPYEWGYEVEDVFVREGRTATVVVQKRRFTDLRYLCVGGKIEASTLPLDLRNQRLLGHLPALIHPSVKKTLIVGLGTGSTAGCFVLHPEVDEITICEIEPAVRDAAANYFAKENHDVVNDPRTTVHFDDARHFLATTGERFDVITSDPINSWIRGAAALYSSEYFELCKRHLNPGGIMVQWIPLYEKDVATLKCELATFLQAFPHATVWTSRNEQDGEHPGGPDLIVIGYLEPTAFDLAELDRRIHANAEVKAALDEVNIGAVPELLGQFLCRGEDLQPWLEDAEINRDRSLRLEYLAGLSLWMAQAEDLFRQISVYRRYPAEFLQNDEAYRDEILQRFDLSESSGP